MKKDLSGKNTIRHPQFINQSVGSLARNDPILLISIYSHTYEFVVSVSNLHIFRAPHSSQYRNSLGALVEEFLRFDDLGFALER